MIKTVKELAKNPIYLGKDRPDPPVTKAMGHLTTTEGPALEEMARIRGSEMVRALSVGYIYSDMYGSKFVRGMIDQLLRISISMDGQGRRDIIDVVDAGGTLPEGYYSGQSKKQTFTPIDEGE